MDPNPAPGNMTPGFALNAAAPSYAPPTRPEYLPAAAMATIVSRSSVTSRSYACGELWRIRSAAGIRGLTDAYIVCCCALGGKTGGALRARGFTAAAKRGPDALGYTRHPASGFGPWTTCMKRLSCALNSSLSNRIRVFVRRQITHGKRHIRWRFGIFEARPFPLCPCCPTHPYMRINHRIDALPSLFSFRHGAIVIRYGHRKTANI